MVLTNIQRRNDALVEPPEKLMKTSQEPKETDFSILSFKDLLPYNEDTKITEEFIEKIVEKLFNHLADSNQRETKLLEFTSPDEIVKKIDFRLPEKQESLSNLFGHLDKILQYSIKTAHPRFFNQVWSGVDTTVLMGEWITSATNTSMYTYEMAPVYVMMEKFVIEKLRESIGFTGGDGMFFPGGAITNAIAMNLARFKMCPDIKQKGLYGCKKFIVYTSNECHYSIQKAAALIGMGTDNVIKIKTDDITGKIIPADLEARVIESIEKGDQPLFAVATCGTTVAGAYDPIEEMADICEKYKIWLHLDGAWGGSCLLSRKHRSLMKGGHRANSLTWDPHKLMGCLQQCSVLLLKEDGLLKAANSANASYLFQKDKKSYDVSWDTGDKTIQCGRRCDVLKLWLMWKAKGSEGIERDIDICWDNSRYLAEKIRERKNFALLREPECTNVCFQYYPPRFEAMPDGPEKEEQLSKVPPEIKKRMLDKGSMMVCYQPLKEHKNFFRMINANPASTHSDMDFVLDEIELLGKDL